MEKTEETVLYEKTCGIVETMLAGKHIMRLEWLSRSVKDFVMVFYQGPDTEQFEDQLASYPMNFLHTQLMDNKYQKIVGNFRWPPGFRQSLAEQEAARGEAGGGDDDEADA